MRDRFDAIRKRRYGPNESSEESSLSSDSSLSTEDDMSDSSDRLIKMVNDYRQCFGDTKADEIIRQLERQAANSPSAAMRAERAWPPPPDPRPPRLKQNRDGSWDFDPQAEAIPILHPEVEDRLCMTCQWRKGPWCKNPVQSDPTPHNWERRGNWDGRHRKCGNAGALWAQKPKTSFEKMIDRISHAMHGPDRKGFAEKLRELVRGPKEKRG
jgi:hypothetical protein